MRDDPVLSTHTRHLEQFNFTVVAEVRSHYVEFRVYDIEGWEVSPVQKPLWTRAGATGHPDPVDTLEESEPYLHGSVKWDGCSNWHFDQQDRVMLHGCSREDVQRFGDVMGYCWDWTAQLCPSWDA